MRAARFHGGGRITIESVPPPCPVAGEVRVDVIACALCSSDLRPLRQGWPVTPGHEIAGRVNEPRHARHGHRVLVYIPAFCGHCAPCRAGHTQFCETASLVGWQRAGGYADTVRVPETCLLPVPDDIPDHLAPLLPRCSGPCRRAFPACWTPRAVTRPAFAAWPNWWTTRFSLATAFGSRQARQIRSEDCEGSRHRAPPRSASPWASSAACGGWAARSILCRRCRSWCATRQDAATSSMAPSRWP